MLVVLMALEATASGLGPFSAGTLAERLIYLDIFMIGAAVTALWVAAMFAERRALEIERVARARLEGILLAARTMEHELGNKLAVTLGWTELLAISPDLPASAPPPRSRWPAPSKLPPSCASCKRSAGSRSRTGAPTCRPLSTSPAPLPPPRQPVPPLLPSPRPRTARVVSRKA